MFIDVYNGALLSQLTHFRRFAIEIPDRKFVNILSIMKDEYRLKLQTKAITGGAKFLLIQFFFKTYADKRVVVAANM